MAIATHVAIISLIYASPTGSIIDKTTATLKQMQDATQEPRVLEDDTIPNTAGNPTIKEYIELEGASDFQLMHIDQHYIITQQI